MTTILGIDEAGRGPVIGPMVLGAIRCTEDQLDELRTEGFSDSKSLSPTVRDEKREFLENHSVHLYSQSIPARKIDNNSLTELSLEATAELINRAEPDKVILDAPGHPSAIPEYLNRLKKRIELSPVPDITAEPGADDTYTVVSAASVLAKTDRDRAIDRLKDRYGELGSGYPSNPNTRSFLKNHLSKQDPVREFIRTRWQTFQDLLSEAGGPLFHDQSPDNDESS